MGPRPLPAAVPLRFEGYCPAGLRVPVTVGIPFPRGGLRDPEALRLVDPRGRRAPLQVAPVARWSDGSVKWLLVDSLLGPGADEGDGWRLGREEGRIGAAPVVALRVRQSPDTIAIETGAATFHVGRGGRPSLRPIIDGRDVLEQGSFRIVLVDVAGLRATAQVQDVSLEAGGPVRATVRIAGRFRGRAGCRFVVRLDAFAGTSLVRVRLTLHNPRRARHRGGLWDLGDPGSIRFRDLAVELALAGVGEHRVTWTAEAGQPPRALDGGGLEIYQGSSGGENWASRNHVNREGRVPASFRGYRVRAGGREESGLRASPTVVLAGPEGRIAAAIPEFWEQFPKALEVEGRTLRARLFPSRFGDPFELQGGEQKTHTVWLDFGSADGVAGNSLGWVHQPVRVRATPGWYAASGALPYLQPAPVGPGGSLDGEVAAVVDGPQSFFARREVIDEYGWRHFGEVYADHEAADDRGPTPIISHYNNQYDLVYGMLLQYYSSGDGRWLDLLDPLARHVADIDIYHTDRDKAAYNGGLFWHTDHYKDAATCTHRAYSRANRQPGRSYGGGPSAEHNYTTGLLHYHYLTGDDSARDAVMSLADWVLAMDDGRRDVLGRVDDGPTGWASCTAEPSYHGPGRGAGNSINALLDGWLLSGRRAYLDTAEALIRRTIHPADDIGARELLETERRWSYTVYLSVLARYLAIKAEAGELDFPYAYARAALLHYADWMREHEVPYFDRPEMLEYPTETWAAQELRKANVLRLAAAHADEPLRSALAARGGELADRAWADLLRFASRGVARAVAILLREGTVDAYFRSHPIEPAPRPDGEFDLGAPGAFVGQRERVRARLRTSGGAVRLAWSLLGGRPRRRP